MNVLTQLQDWLDEAAAGMIRIAYLLAGVTAVAVYFGAGHLPPAVEAGVNGALPWVLAFAVETHTYITALRVRSAWQEKLWHTFKINLSVLAGLLAFSVWNQLNYLYETWTPPRTALALPGWTAYLVRALVVPGAFMAAAFLAPLAQPVAAQIEAEARNVLADVFRIARKQRRRMLKVAEREGRDMTGALVHLVHDPDLRGVIAHTYSAIAADPEPPVRTPPSWFPPDSPIPPDPHGGNVPPSAVVNRDDATRSNVRALTPSEPRMRRQRVPKPIRADTARPASAAKELRAKREASVRRILARNPDSGARSLARQVAMATQHSCSASTAQELRAQNPRRDARITHGARGGSTLARGKKPHPAFRLHSCPPRVVLVHPEYGQDCR